MGQRQLKSITRKAALDNFSSAELLDQLLIVIAARSWIMLCIIGAILIAALSWGFAGSIPVQIDGMGIIIEKNAPLRIANTTATGAVLKSMANPGDVLEAGTEILIFGNPAANTDVKQAKETLESLIAQDKDDTKEEQDAFDKLKASIDLQTTAANETIEKTRELLALYQTQVKEYEKLSKDKLIPSSQLTSAQATLFSAQENERNLVASLAQYQSQLQTQQAENAALQSTRTTAIQNARSNLAKAESNQSLNNSFKAPMRCRVVSMLVNTGDFVSPGTDLLIAIPLPPTSDKDASTQQAIGFVNYGTGKEVKPGMLVQVSLPFASSTEYGFIKGTVRSASTFATDEDALANQVGSSSLADIISTSTSGVPMQVMVDLITDDSTQSGFAWTSANGFPGKIPQLSECQIKITTHYERPIDLVLPWFKQILGIDSEPDLPSST